MGATYRFGSFELDTAAYTLRDHGRTVPLERIPMEILILLVANAGTLVGRGAIHGALWSDRFMDHDAAINTAIRKIRRALGDDPSAPRFVETVVGKGYRFTAAVMAPVRRDGSHEYVLTRGDRHFRLAAGENLIGRAPSAAVCLDHASVSRRHALLSIDGPRALLEDMASRNGTFVDGRRIHAPTEVRDGAIIGIGPIALTFTAVAPPASTRPVNGARADRPPSGGPT